MAKSAAYEYKFKISHDFDNNFAGKPTYQQNNLIQSKGIRSQAYAIRNEINRPENIDVFS